MNLDNQRDKMLGKNVGLGLNECTFASDPLWKASKWERISPLKSVKKWWLFPKLNLLTNRVI